jgi:hypothetical protein
MSFGAHAMLPILREPAEAMITGLPRLELSFPGSMTYRRRRRVTNGEEFACRIHPVAETDWDSLRSCPRRQNSLPSARVAARRLPLSTLGGRRLCFVFPDDTDIARWRSLGTLLV